MTECGPLISYAGWKEHRLLSCGKLLEEYCEIKIDSDDQFNTAGEILIRGEQVMYGYYKNEEDTKNALDKEGWLHTGDIGVIDKDNYIYIKGRSKNMLLGSSGQNIYPEEIEAKINNMPFVVESVVVQREQKIIALVYPDMIAADELDISKNELEILMEENRKNLNNKLGSYEAVQKFELFPTEFEKTAKKSIKRFMYK